MTVYTGSDDHPFRLPVLSFYIMTGILINTTIADKLNDSGDEVSDIEEENLYLEPETNVDDTHSSSPDSDIDDEDGNILLKWRKTSFNNKSVPQNIALPSVDDFTPPGYFKK
ncbi:hypothetical protein EVAR_42091_1 [Eumeta japonica]|uniref:Uncharacterized protein n=1 Tax=Eumeta variegata TaxID=151549 RepID=A0A4C1XJ98_EUMVA|nr:hypothetical protein EVAR_42091_1 [Eumeta japonica]